MASQYLVQSPDERNPVCFGGGRGVEILVSKVYEWEVCCSAICRVQYRARGNCDCESVMDALLCIQRGQDRGVEREREKMHEAKDP